MKVLQITPFFSPKFGGSVASTYLLCQKLVEFGHSVTILTTDFHFDSSYAETLKNVEIIPIECKAHIGLFLYSPKIKAWLSQNLHMYDIIHMQDYRSYQNAMVSNYAQKLGIPYIIQARGSVLPFFEKQILKNCFDFIWGYWILKNSTICIALTKPESQAYKKMGVPIGKIRIIPNGIDNSQYTDLPSYGHFRSKFKILETERVLLFLGRIHKIKGIELLVSSFYLLSKEIDNVKLVIAGPDGGSLFQIKKQISKLHLEDKIIFVGPLYGNNKIEAYIDSDVYILPSKYEAFPNTILEASACGTPVIITDRCNISDWVDNNVGLVVPYNKFSLKKAIKFILENKEISNKFSFKGRELTKEKFEINNIVKQIEHLYIECIKCK